jgi:hypothetical protein
MRYTCPLVTAATTAAGREAGVTGCAKTFKTRPHSLRHAYICHGQGVSMTTEQTTDLIRSSHVFFYSEREIIAAHRYEALYNRRAQSRLRGRKKSDTYICPLCKRSLATAKSLHNHKRLKKIHMRPHRENEWS